MFATVYRYRCLQLFLAVFSLIWILAAAVEEKGITDGKKTINSDGDEILPQQNKELVVTDTVSTEQEASDQPEPTQLRPRRKVTYDANGFYLNGKPALLRGGTFQWFRLPAEVWEDRMIRFKALGYNAIDMYVAWSSHEPEDGVFDFKRHDIVRFLELAQKYSMYVYFRPGPYITNEMDGGGLPTWILTKSNKRLYDPHNLDGTVNFRTDDRDFMVYVRRYFNRLNTVIKPFLYSNGGPIILYAIENEFNFAPTAMSFEMSSYLPDGKPERDPKQRLNHRAYLKALRDAVRDDGIDVPITTCPGVPAAEGMYGVKDIIPLPNYYGYHKQFQYVGFSLLEKLHDPKTNYGANVNHPSGMTETSRTTSTLKSFVMGGLDAIFQFNAMGYAQEGRLNSIIPQGHAFVTAKIILDMVKAWVDFKNPSPGTAFVRPWMGLLHNVIDYDGPISPSGLLRSKFYSLRAANLFFNDYEHLIAAQGLPYRSSLTRKKIRNHDTSIRVHHKDLGSKDPDTGNERVSYFFRFNVKTKMSLLDLFNGKARDIEVSKLSIEAYGVKFPKYTGFTVPFQRDPGTKMNNKESPELASNVLIPLNWDLGDGFSFGYSTSEILTSRKWNGERLVIVYGKEFGFGEINIKAIDSLQMLQKSKEIDVKDATSNGITIVYKHDTPSVITFRNGRSILRLVIASEHYAARSWFMSSPSNQQFVVIGPDFVDETKKTWRPQLQFEKTSLVYFLSPVPLEIDGLHVIAAYDRKSRLSGFIHYSNPKPALSDRLLSSGYTTSENLPNQVGPGWISLGSKLSQMEKHKIYEGSAWYTGEVELSKKQASRSDLRLFIEFASDFVKIFVNGHYLRTVFPLGTEIDNRAGGSYRFKIPSRFLRPGKNILHFHVTIWGHGAFFWPNGVLRNIPIGTFKIPFPGKFQFPALGYDSLKGLNGTSTLDSTPITNWKIRGKLTGELNGYHKPTLQLDQSPTKWTRSKFPIQLSPGEVVWYRGIIRSEELPSTLKWDFPVSVQLKGQNALATVYVNGMIIGRWISDNDWMKSGNWLQPQRKHYSKLDPDHFPIFRETLKPGDNSIVIAFEDTSIQEFGRGGLLQCFSPKDDTCGVGGVIKDVRLIASRELLKFGSSDGYASLVREKVTVKMGEMGV